jgi:hypothetical protein
MGILPADGIMPNRRQYKPGNQYGTPSDTGSPALISVAFRTGIGLKPPRLSAHLSRRGRVRNAVVGYGTQRNWVHFGGLLHACCGVIEAR